MLRYMLDTNICIYVMNNHPGEFRVRFNRLRDHLSISTISLAELLFGAEKSRDHSRNLQSVDEFTARLQVLSFSPAAAAHYGQIRTELSTSGKIAGPHDMLIGAHARSEGMILVTNNTWEFSRISGLRVENWLEKGEHP